MFPEINVTAPPGVLDEGHPGDPLLIRGVRHSPRVDIDHDGRAVVSRAWLTASFALFASEATLLYTFDHVAYPNAMRLRRVAGGVRDVYVRSGAKRTASDDVADCR
jgi:hypothetical protein